MPGPIRYVCGLIADAEATSRTGAFVQQLAPPRNGTAVSVMRAHAMRATPSMRLESWRTECELSS
jgi:hypothetical protein